jgi:methylenetetrahydrofolate reductase (NADPH)
MVSSPSLSETDESELARIVSFVTPASFEITHKEVNKLPELSATLAPGTPLHVTHLPGAAPDALAAAAAEVRRAGLEPVPHLAARNFKSKAEAERLVSALASEAKAQRVFVIGGDSPTPAGPFTSAFDLLETGLIEGHGIQTVGFGGHPEGHPKVSDSALKAALVDKIASAQRRGLSPFVVTQFCFEAEPVLKFVQYLRARGLDVPIRVGITGPARLDALIKFSLRCGVGASIRALTQHSANVARLLTVSGPEPLVKALACGLAPDSNIAGLHFFAVGGVARCAAWANAVRHGRVALVAKGDGFQVELER